MHIHHLNCGSLSPHFPKLKAIVYCPLVETSDGLLLVDTGFGTRDYTQPSPMMHFFLWLMGVPKNIEETAAHQVMRLGYAVEDVRHIVLTHLNLDHAGGLPDFPHAQVHVYRQEYEAAHHPRRIAEFGCDKRHWAHGPHWMFYDAVATTWFGFDAIRVLPDVSPKIYLIPLPGHTRGHCGVAIQTEDGWLLNCGDAATPFHTATALRDSPDMRQPMNFLLPASLSRYIIGPHIPRLRQLLHEHGEEVDIISEHDIYSFERHQRDA